MAYVTPTTGSVPSTKKRKNFTLLCEEHDDEPEPELTSNEIIIRELRLYTSLSTRGITEYSCPLQFYKSNLQQLPNMARIAKMLFCITASSVPSECLFSKSGELITKKRSRLNPELAEDLLILRMNKFEI